MFHTLDLITLSYISPPPHNMALPGVHNINSFLPWQLVEGFYVIAASKRDSDSFIEPEILLYQSTTYICRERNRKE